MNTAPLRLQAPLRPGLLLQHKRVKVRLAAAINVKQHSLHIAAMRGGGLRAPGLARNALRAPGTNGCAAIPDRWRPWRPLNAGRDPL